jgi:hypothetical protein
VHPAPPPVPNSSSPVFNAAPLCVQATARPQRRGAHPQLPVAAVPPCRRPLSALQPVSAGWLAGRLPARFARVGSEGARSGRATPAGAVAGEDSRGKVRQGWVGRDAVWQGRGRQGGWGRGPVRRPPAGSGSCGRGRGVLLQGLPKGCHCVSCL